MFDLHLLKYSIHQRNKNKSGKDHFKALDLKNGFLGDDKSLFYELILALVSLWLLVNSFEEISKEKRLIDFFDYFIQRYYDYFIIIFFKIF